MTITSSNDLTSYAKMRFYTMIVICHRVTNSWDTHRVNIIPTPWVIKDVHYKMCCVMQSVSWASKLKIDHNITQQSVKKIQMI